MYLLKKYSSLLLFLFVGCNTVQPLETNKDLFGYYESSVFIEPGSLDGGIDIIANGGYLNIILKDDFKFTAELFIPDSIYSNYASGLRNFEGSFSLQDDTLKFEAQYLVVNSLKWNEQKKQLESFEVPLRGRPFKIVLVKYLR